MKTPEQIAEIREKAVTMIFEHNRCEVNVRRAVWQDLMDAEDEQEVTVAATAYYMLVVEEYLP